MHCSMPGETSFMPAKRARVASHLRGGCRCGRSRGSLDRCRAPDRSAACRRASPRRVGPLDACAAARASMARCASWRVGRPRRLSDANYLRRSDAELFARSASATATVMRLRPLSAWICRSYGRGCAMIRMRQPGARTTSRGLITDASGSPRKTRRAWVAEDGQAFDGICRRNGAFHPRVASGMRAGIRACSARRRAAGESAARSMETVLAWAADLGAKEIWLEVRKSNMRAVRLYQRCGFTIAGARPGYYVDPREDALLMRRQIGYG